jgi:hypothetical protein
VSTIFSNSYMRWLIVFRGWLTLGATFGATKFGTPCKIYFHWRPKMIAEMARDLPRAARANH